MSNSGTWTSCFADFIKLPKPALRAKKSLSSLMTGTVGTTGDVLSAPFLASRSGDAERVAGNENMSMSIFMDERRRRAGSSGNTGLRVIVGLGGSEALSTSMGLAGALSSERCPRRSAVDGRSKDHERTRSSART